MTPLPPWLDFTPQGFASAAEAGRRLNQGDQQIGLERQKLAESASQAASQLRLEGQKLDQAKKQAAMEHQVQMEQLQNNFLREQTQASMAKAYHDAQIGLGEDRVTEQAKAAAFAHADRLAALGSRSISEKFDAVPEQKAYTDDPTSQYAGHLLHPSTWFDWKTIPGASHPAVEGHPAYTLTRKIPSGVPDDFANPGTPQPTNAPGPLPVFKFVRDKDGNLVVDNSQSADTQPTDSQPAQ